MVNVSFKVRELGMDHVFGTVVAKTREEALALAAKRFPDVKHVRVQGDNKTLPKPRWRA